MFKAIPIVLLLIVLFIIVKIIRLIKRIFKAFFRGIKNLFRESYEWEESREEVRKKIKRESEEQKRRDMPCYFVDGISQEEFKLIVKRSGKYIKRISYISTLGAEVFGTVRSQSGISEWDFRIDFNDYGHLTGEYWIVFKENLDSNIPDQLAKYISKAIIQRKFSM